MPTHRAEAAASLEVIERAAVRGWPALETAEVDRWLLRVSSGGSVRANSISALQYSGADFDASLAEAVAFYRARRALPRFTITGVSQPSGLDGELAARGWTRQGDHLTMAKDVGFAAPPRAGSDVMVIRHQAPTPEWYAVYLEGLSQNRRAVAPQLVERVPRPRCFFSGVRDGKVIASGLSVLDVAVSSVQCMATLAQARRTGAARAVLDAIEDYAREGGALRLYLQADAENKAAINLYERAGFAVAGRYHTRELAE
ncbi:MAG: GNAT family N-acetyltransferase [Hyphomicrobiaceae bacterium]